MSFRDLGHLACCSALLQTGVSYCSHYIATQSLYFPTNEPLSLAVCLSGWPAGHRQISRVRTVIMQITQTALLPTQVNTTPTVTTAVAAVTDPVAPGQYRFYHCTALPHCKTILATPKMIGNLNCWSEQYYLHMTNTNAVF